VIEYDDYTVHMPVVTTPKMLPKTTVVLPVAMLSISPLPFPDAYVVMRGLRHTTAYDLAAIPPLAFDAWIKAQAEDALLIAAILGVDRSRWSLEEKWCVINELTLRGVELPLCDREEAERLWAIEIKSGQLGNGDV